MGRTLSAGLVVTLLAVTSAWGQKPPTAQQKRAAQAHFQAGKAYYDAGAWDDAVREYQRAYQLVPLAELLYNIGQAYRMKGDKPKALAAYERYLVAVPEGALADEARQHVALLRSQLRVEEVEAERRKTAEELTAARRQAAEAEAARRRATADAAAGARAPRDETDEARRGDAAEPGQARRQQEANEASARRPPAREPATAPSGGSIAAGPQSTPVSKVAFGLDLGTTLLVGLISKAAFGNTTVPVPVVFSYMPHRWIGVGSALAYTYYSQDDGYTAHDIFLGIGPRVALQGRGLRGWYLSTLLGFAYASYRDGSGSSGGDAFFALRPEIGYSTYWGKPGFFLSCGVGFRSLVGSSSRSYGSTTAQILSETFTPLVSLALGFDL